jgi:hypothetical protein
MTSFWHRTSRRQLGPTWFLEPLPPKWKQL